MITYKKIVDTLEKWSIDNNIETFYHGDVFKFNTQVTDKYTAMLVTPISSSINGTQISHNFDIMFLDLLDIEESNLLDIWNDTYMNCRDLLSSFSTYSGDINDYDYDMRIDDTNITMRPTLHIFDSNLAGRILNINIITPLDLSYCKNQSV